MSDKYDGLSPGLAEASRLADEKAGRIAPDAWRQKVFDAATLQGMTFPPLKFILPGYVPEGATLLVSRPKLGKSWLVLDLAIATAAGRFTLGELKPAGGCPLSGARRWQAATAASHNKTPTNVFVLVATAIDNRDRMAPR
jgi:AAA domain